MNLHYAFNLKMENILEFHVYIDDSTILLWKSLLPKNQTQLEGWSNSLLFMPEDPHELVAIYRNPNVFEEKNTIPRANIMNSA